MVAYVSVHMATVDHNCIPCKQEECRLCVLLYIIRDFRIVFRDVLFYSISVYRWMEHGCDMVDCRNTIRYHPLC